MNNGKKIGILAVIGVIVGIPVAIWKSSKIGRLVFVFTMIFVLGFAINTISKHAFKAMYNYKSMKAGAIINEKLTKAEKSVDEIKAKISEINTSIKEKAQQRIDEIVQEKTREFLTLVNEDKRKLRVLSDRIKSLTNSVDIIKEEQRAAVKERLISLNEKVNVLKVSVDSVEVRSELELIASNTQLLNVDERKRLFDELEEVGFRIKKEKEFIHYGIMTGEVIGWYR